MPIIKWKHKSIEVKPYDLINVAVQSIAHKGDLSEFWQYVQGYRTLGLLKMSLDEIKRLLEINGNKIYGTAEDMKEHYSKSGNFGLGYEVGGFSGCVPICETPQQKMIVSAEAQKKATDLLLSLKDYGWVFLSNDEAFHTRLCLDIKFGHQIELKVPGRSRVCLNFSDPVFGLIKKDDVVSLAFSAMFDNNFINHICKFDTDYKERLNAFLGDYRTKGVKKHGQRSNNPNLPNKRGGFTSTHKIIPLDRGTGISVGDATPSSG
jgi:hypothetical protein